MSWVKLKKNNETLKRHPLQGPITSTGAFLEPFQELFKLCQGHLKTQQPCHPQTSPGQSSIILKFEKPHVYKTTCERAHDRSTADNWCNPNKSQLQDMNHQIRQSDCECCCCPDNICPMVCMRPDRTHTLPDWASHPQTNGSRERVIPRVLEGERENKWVEEEGREGVSLGPWEPSLCQCKRATDNFIPSPLPHLSQWGTPLPKHNADQHLTIYCCYSIPWVRRRLQSDWTVPAVCVCVHYCCAMTLYLSRYTHTLINSCLCNMTGFNERVNRQSICLNQEETLVSTFTLSNRKWRFISNLSHLRPEVGFRFMMKLRYSDCFTRH